MKKLVSSLLLLSGVFSFAQSTIFVMTNNTHFDVEARFLTGPKSFTITNRYMYAGATNSYSTFTIPAMFYTKYGKFDIVGDPANNLPMHTWYLIDPSNPAVSGTYLSNDPIISTMNSLNEWGMLAIRLSDPTSGQTMDTYEIGDPIISSNLGFSIPMNQIGANTGHYAQWYTIGDVTFFQID